MRETTTVLNFTIINIIYIHHTIIWFHLSLEFCSLRPLLSLIQSLESTVREET